MGTPYQITREQLTDQQWSDLCRLFEFTAELKRRLKERRATAQ